MEKMDPNKTIDYLVFSQDQKDALFDRVRDYFKCIKDITILSRGWCYGCLYLMARPCIRKDGKVWLCPYFGQPNETIFRETISNYIGYVHWSDSYMVHCLVNEGYYTSSEFKPLDGIETKHFKTSNLTSRMLHVCLYKRKGDFIISQIFNTLSLRELYIEITEGPADLFANCKLDYDYPNLVLLAILSHDVDAETIAQSIPRSTHHNLRFLTIATMSVSDSLARRICELMLQFPKASINWWSARYSQISVGRLIEHQHIFSSNIAPGCIGIQWTPKSMELTEAIKLQYKVGENENEVVVELRKQYSDSELMLIISLFCDMDCLYYY